MDESMIDAIFTALISDDSPGCAVGVVKDGKLDFSKGYGLANLEHNIPITPQSVFRIGSISKQFTAACVAILHLRGEINLEDKFSKYFPEMDYHQDITIRHIIYHTSGIMDYFSVLILANYTFQSASTLNEEEVVDYLSKVRGVNFDPGSQFSYSNSGYFLLSQLVKRVTGKTLRQFAEEEIFVPLKMRYTHYHNNFREIVPLRASGYGPTKSGFEINMTNFDITGDGAVFTTIEDFFNWDQNFTINNIGIDKFQELVLSYDTVDRGSKRAYGFGLGHGKYKGKITIIHGGSFVGFESFYMRFPEENLSVIIFCNRSDLEPHKLAKQVADVYLGTTDQEEESILAGRQVKEKEVINLTKFKIAIGKYWDSENYERGTLEIKDNKLIYQMGREYELHTEVENNEEGVISFFSEEGFLDIVIHIDLKRGMISYETERSSGEFRKVTDTPKDLTLFAGRYKNAELDVTCEIHVTKPGLTINNRMLKDNILDPVSMNVFFVKFFQLSFSSLGDNGYEKLEFRNVDMKSVGFDRIA